MKDNTLQTRLDDFTKAERNINENVAKAKLQEGLQFQNLKGTSLDFEYHPAGRDDNGRFSPKPDFVTHYNNTDFMDEFKHHPSGYPIHEGNFYSKLLSKCHYWEARHPGRRFIRIFTGGNVPEIQELLKLLREHNFIARFHPTIKPGKKYKNLRRLIKEFLNDTLWSILHGSSQAIYRFSQWLGRRKKRVNDRLSVATKSLIHHYLARLDGLEGVGGVVGVSITVNTAGSSVDVSYFWRFTGW